MKLTSILLIAAFLSVSAKTISQTISYSAKNVPLEKIFPVIEQQTGFVVFCNASTLTGIKPVSVDAEKMNLDVFLSRLLLETPLEYSIKDKTIFISRKTAPAISIIPAAELAFALKGVVLTEDGKPLTGATVSIKHSRKSVVTNADGKFTLEVNEGNIIVVSYIGYQPKEYKISASNKNENLVIRLSLKTDDLVQVQVVTGYTNVDKRLSASSVSTVKGEDLERKDFLSVDQMLQGKVPGLNVNITSTTPGAAPKLRLRGTSTLLGNREPIWVVDGFVVDAPVKISAQDINSLDNVNLLTSPIAGINPNDIERIDVLKDASATAIYGVNGANGVIVITTKRGKYNQKMTVNYSSNLVMQTAPGYDHLPLMNSKERIDVSREIIDRGLNYSVAQPRIGFEGAYLDYKDGLISFDEFEKRANYFETLNTNWYDVLFRNSFSQSHNISFSAGSLNTTYYASLGFADQNSSAIFNNQKRYTGLFKLNSQLNNKLTIGLKMSGSINTSETPFIRDLYGYAYNTSRALEFEKNGERVAYVTDVVSVGTSSENYAAGYNIMNELEGSRRKNNNRSMDFSANIDWKFLRNFRLTGNYSFITTQSKGSSYATEETYYIAQTYRETIKPGIDIPAALKPDVIMPRGGEYRESNAIRNAFTVRNAIDYTRRIGQHFFSATAGNEIRSTEYNTTNSFRLGYLPDRGLIFYTPNQAEYPKYYSELSRGAYPPVTLSNKIDRFVSWYGIFIYSLKNRYTLNMNVRNDGSNRFGTDINKKFLPTFSSAVRWMVSDEEWFAKSNNLNLLALRLSYGFNGNIPETESPRLIITQPGINNVNYQDYSTVVSYPNPLLRWEKTNTVNLGLEFSLFNNFVTGEFELYYKKGKDLISTIEVPASNGVNTIALNGAGIENKGYEVTLNFNPVRSKNWNWKLGVLFGRNYSTILESDFAEVRAVLVSRDENYFSGINNYLYGNVIREGVDPASMH